ELFGGEGRALGQGLELGPYDVWVAHPATESTIGPGDNVLLAHDLRETYDALGYQLRMLDEVAGVAHDPRDERRAVGQLYVLPDLPLVLVAGVGRLHRVGRDGHPEHDVGDVLERDVVLMGPMVAAPADVQADALDGNLTKRMIQRLDAQLGELTVVGDAH